jgi:hypothetical protein
MSTGKYLKLRLSEGDSQRLRSERLQRSDMERIIRMHETAIGEYKRMLSDANTALQRIREISSALSVAGIVGHENILVIIEETMRRTK